QCGWQAGGALCPGGLCCSQYGWCGNTDPYCGQGCQSQCGGSGGTGGGSVASIISSSLFEQMLKHRNDAACPGKGFYTYNAFIAAANSFSGFGTTGDDATKKREIAAFLAQTSHETTGNSAIGSDLLNNPDLVATDATISFKTALWFWMTPQSPKPSCHDVITGRWTPSNADQAAGRLPGYGVTTNIINGGLECGKGYDARVADRIGFYKSSFNHPQSSSYVGCMHCLIYSIQSRSTLLPTSYVAQYIVVLSHTASSKACAEELCQALLLVIFTLASSLGAFAEQCGRQAGGALCPGGLCCSQYGWCGNTDPYCGQGCQSQCAGSTPSPSTPSGGGSVGSIISSSLFEQMLKHRNDAACPGNGFYTYNAFIAAANSFSGFGTTGDDATKKREIAAFLAQTSHETTGNSAISSDLLNNPDLVATDATISFKTALWFWMTPQSPKPSCHDVITGSWTPSNADRAAGRLPGYGVTTNIINGGLECGKGSDARVADRIGFYKRYC
ncbi:unnamed protein product, partial [Musa hybrid cultivar]